MKRHVFALVFVAVWMAVAPDAAAQAISAKPAPGLHISARIGLSYYGGDLDAANSENDWSRQAFGAELAWHLSPRWAILAAYQQGEYPRIQDPLRLRTAIAMIRFVPVTGRLSPFVQAGINRTYGGVEVAGGPSAGIGINLAITNKLYLFQEANVNFVSPDGAIDNQAGGSNFDLIGFVGGGLRIANLGVRYAKPVRIEKVHIPRTLTTDDAATFRAEVNDDASMPVLFAWTFSDGPRLIGNPISFRFTRPGEHTIQVTAENASGSDVKEYRVFVEQGDIPFVAPEENTPGQIELSTAETPAPRPERTTPRRPVDQLDLAEAKAEASLAISQAELAVAQAELALAQAKEAITLARNATRSIENVTGTPIAQGPSRPAPATVEPAPEPGVETSSAPAPVPSPVSTPEPELPDADDPVMDEAPDMPAPDPVAEAEETMADTAEEMTEPERRPAPSEATAPAEPPTRGYAWVLTSKPVRADAEREQSRYLSAGYESYIVPAVVGGTTYYRVTVGQYDTRRQAQRARRNQLPPDTPSDAWLLRFSG